MENLSSFSYSTTVSYLTVEHLLTKYYMYCAYVYTTTSTKSFKIKILTYILTDNRCLFYYLVKLNLLL